MAVNMDSEVLVEAGKKHTHSGQWPLSNSTLVSQLPGCPLIFLLQLLGKKPLTVNCTGL